MPTGQLQAQPGGDQLAGGRQRVWPLRVGQRRLDREHLADPAGGRPGQRDQVEALGERGDLEAEQGHPGDEGDQRADGEPVVQHGQSTGEQADPGGLAVLDDRLTVGSLVTFITWMTLLSLCLLYTSPSPRDS